MIFNSGRFLLFFLAFFLLYWILGKNKLKFQTVLLLIGSYIFYFVTDWRLLAYLIFASFVNYILGLEIARASTRKKKRLFVNIGILQGIGGLFYFKYLNFFIEQFNDLFQMIGLNSELRTLNILIPLGISFYTFKTISYVLEVKNKKIEAEKNWIVFFAYVSFFPTLLAGPIDKAQHFLPQLKQKKEFNYGRAVLASRQILWGLFKKVVIADQLATITNTIFDSYQDYSGSTLLISAFLYAIQVYADFSGYSDMAIGIGKLLGFKVTKNFNYPFYAQNIAQFWRNWHMSLTNWITEYVFTPLSFLFRDYGKWGLSLAVMINLIIIGIWHGANWTYLVFGIIHGLYFIPLVFSGKLNQRNGFKKGQRLPTFGQAFKMLKTFFLVMISLIVFRSESITDSFHMFGIIMSKTIFEGVYDIKSIYWILAFFLLVVEWFHKDDEFVMLHLNSQIKMKSLRWVLYIFLIMLIIYYQISEQEYVYFQF